MKTREILNEKKEIVISNEIERLNQFTSYQEGLRNAKEQANKNYDQAIRSINQKRWFKIIHQENEYPTIIWTNNSSLTMIAYPDGNFKYDDEIEGNSNFCRVIGASSRDFISFHGTIQEVIEVAKNKNFKGEKLLAPVEFFI